MNLVSWLVTLSMLAQMNISFPGPRGTAAGGSSNITYVTSQKSFCSGCTSTSYSFPSSTANNNEILIIMDVGGQSSASISSVTGTGTTWATPPSGCVGNETIAAFTVSCAYSISNSSGATSVTINWSGSAATHVWVYYEYKCSATPTYQDSNNDYSSSGVNPLPGVSVSMTGATDAVIIQSGWTENFTPSAISGGYGRFTTDTQMAFATLENTTTGTAPNWTISGSSRGVSNGLAMKCQ